MKKLIAIILTFILALTTFLAFGCGKPIEKITDLREYRKMTDQTDRIDVYYDNQTGKYFTFSITDKAQIDEIMQVVLYTQLEYIGDGQYAGDLTYIVIVQGEKEYRLSTVLCKQGDKNYSFSGKLNEKINQIARALGAYDMP